MTRDLAASRAAEPPVFGAWCLRRCLHWRQWVGRGDRRRDAALRRTCAGHVPSRACAGPRRGRFVSAAGPPVAWHCRPVGMGRGIRRHATRLISAQPVQAGVHRRGARSAAVPAPSADARLGRASLPGARLDPACALPRPARRSARGVPSARLCGALGVEGPGADFGGGPQECSEAHHWREGVSVGRCAFHVKRSGAAIEDPVRTAEACRR